MRPRFGERVVNTRGSLIGRISWGGWAHGNGSVFWVRVGHSRYRVIEWDRSWAAWIAFGRGVKLI